MEQRSWTDPEAVAANRAGHLTPIQEQMSRSSELREAPRVGAGVGLIGGLGACSRALVHGLPLGLYKGMPELPPAGWYQLYWWPDRTATAVINASRRAAAPGAWR